MHNFFGFSLAEWGLISAFISGIFGGCMGLIRYFKLSITAPMTKAIDELRLDIKDFNSSRKENESKLFKLTDDHTKEIGELYGRVNTLEVITQSNTTRLDRTLK
ncbi:hypothetical protein VNN41_06350 [Lactococcus garvieae]|uniref:hypothetical protein n=1 Tax=Lactococcus garvieae TaxID=1363 RepID=UPI0030D184D6